MTVRRLLTPTATLVWITTMAALLIAASPDLMAQTIPLQAQPPETEPSSEQAARQERLAFLTRVFAEFKIFSSEDENSERSLLSTENPVLRYGNPVRKFFSDGVTFFWLDGNRPAAAASIAIRNNVRVFREFTSLSDHPLKCQWKGQTVWTPQSGNLVKKPIVDGPKPASTPSLRLIQLRQLSRRFTVVMQDGRALADEPPFKTLRLLPNPLYHWSDSDTGLVNGAVFSFCEATDPEALLLLEIDGSDEDPIWTCSFARMTSRPLTLHMNDQKILYLKSYFGNLQTENDSYSTTRMGMYEPGV